VNDGKIVVLARNAQQFEEWRLSLRLPRGVAVDALTSYAVRGLPLGSVLVRLPGWDMRSYREVAPVVRELAPRNLPEKHSSDFAAFAGWRPEGTQELAPLGLTAGEAVADAVRAGGA
jgi:hypothetical protein